MTGIQIQLPDELYRRAKAFAEQRKLSLDEIARRGIELVISCYPAESPSSQSWTLPRIHGGGLKVPLEQLHEINAEDESARSQR